MDEEVIELLKEIRGRLIHLEKHGKPPQVLVDTLTRLSGELDTAKRNAVFWETKTKQLEAALDKCRRAPINLADVHSETLWKELQNRMFPVED